jgi:hypothetical protein
MVHVAVGGTLNSEAIPMAHICENYCQPCCELAERRATSFELGRPRKTERLSGNKAFTTKGVRSYA